MSEKPGLTITDAHDIPLLYFKTAGMNIGISLNWGIVNGNMIVVPGVWYFPYYIEDGEVFGFESFDHFRWSLEAGEHIYLHPSIYWRRSSKYSQYNSHHESFLDFQQMFLTS